MELRAAPESRVTPTRGGLLGVGVVCWGFGVVMATGLGGGVTADLADGLLDESFDFFSSGSENGSSSLESTGLYP